ncbi:hypothetical protein NNC19_07935 [Clostridium sp. SHJSY1]|uniref:hypothetical protein n=1 Tax=Clostridium sp. SHJSY1 TaxID=2942483 RepID=UPI00287586B3|nr:hypothetical protein [Clostridium sp. SHJSY1]MDS0525603.1 hypothetical protein [Clostridium sp. SHJSY1]
MSIKKREKLIGFLTIFLLVFIGGISTIVYSANGTKVAIKFGNTEAIRGESRNQWATEISDSNADKNNEVVDKEWFVNSKNTVQFVVDLGKVPSGVDSSSKPFTVTSKLNDAEITGATTDIKPDKGGTFIVTTTLPTSVSSGKLKFSVNFDDGNTWGIVKATKSFTVNIDNNAPKVEYTGANSSVVKNNAIYEPFEMNIKLNEENKKYSNVVTTIYKKVDKINDKDSKVYEYNWNNKDEDSFTYKFDEDGEYTIKTTGSDRAYNTVEGSTADGTSIKFAISKSLSQIKIIGVENGEEIKSNESKYCKSSSYKISVENFFGVNIISSNYTITDKNKSVVDNGNFIFSGISKGRLEKKTKALGEGEYTVNVNLVKWDGSQTNSSFSLNVDGKAPSVLFNYGGKNYNASEIVYSNQKNTSASIQINDKNLSKYIVTVKKGDATIATAKLDGSNEDIQDESGNNGAVKLEFESKDATAKKIKFSSLKDGKYTVKVEAEDKSGNKYSPNSGSSEDKQVVTFVMDAAKPSIKLEKDMKAYYNLKNEDETPKPVIDITDDNFDTSTITVIRDEKVIASVNEKGEFSKGNGETITVKKDSNSNKFNFSEIKQDGVYKIDIVSKDRAGNELNTTKDDKNKQIKFTIDQSAPIIDIKAVEANGNLSNLENNKTYYYNQNKLVNISISDVNHNKDLVEITDENGKNLTVSPLQGTGIERKTSYNFTEEGTYKIKVESTDSAGNTTTRNVVVIVDKTAPIIEIEDFDKLNNSFSNPEKTVTVKVTENHYENDIITVKYEKITPDGKVETFNPKFGTEGRGVVTRQTYADFEDDAEYRMTVTAKDGSGNIAVTKSVVFTTDKTKPAVSITGVDADNYYNVDKTVNLTSVDVNQLENNATVTRNGQNYNVGNFVISGRTASLSHTFTQEGNYEINFSSKDKAGNTNSTSIKFTIDKTAPKITPMMSNDGTVIKDGAYINRIFTPIFKLDNSEDTINTVTLNNGGNIVGNIPMVSVDGKFSYVVVASDKAKNQTTLNLTFTLDTTTPQIKISGIMAGFFNKDITPKFEMTDTNLDAARTSSTLNGAPFASGTKLEKQQDYNFKLVATDLANNKKDDAISFTIDKDKPIIRFETPMSGKYFTDTVIPKFIIDDLTDYTIISMTLDGEDYEMGDPIEAEGKHVLFIEVKDKAGNIENISVEFIIDKTPPKFIVEGIEENKTYLEAAAATIKLDNPDDKIESITVNGELIEKHDKDEIGQDVYKLNFTDVKSYEVLLKATDIAGNKTEQKINLNVANKTVLTTIYTNKFILYPLIAGVVIAVAGLGFAIFRKGPKKAFKTEYTD